MRTAFNSARAPQFPQLAVKTYAAYPVWSGSTTAAVKFAPFGETKELSKKIASKIFHHARRFERQTAITRRDAFGKVSTQGAIGRMGILVLHTLLFDFMNHRTGRLDPSWASIAERAGISRRSVHRALTRLQATGILSWAKRCAGRVLDGRFVLEQESNAYAVAPQTQWNGYRPAPEPPPPDPAGWGKAPSVPALGVQAGDGAGRMAVVLQGAAAGGDRLAAALAGLGRRR